MLSQRDLQALVEHTYDLLIALDETGKVLSVSQDIDLPAMSLYEWIGTPFSEVLTVESLVKLPLLREDAFTVDSGPKRWRHINLRMGQQILPILAKYTEFRDKSGMISRLVFGRDLRPIQRLQSQLVSSHDKVVKNYEGLIQAVSEKSQALDRLSAELIPYDQISQQAQGIGLDQALAPFVQRVRSEVVARKLQQTHQNIERSAQELGLSLAEVQTIADEVAKA
jgi:transcriptional regulator with PAS, ATPase and Fis domain